MRFGLTDDKRSICKKVKTFYIISNIFICISARCKWIIHTILINIIFRYHKLKMSCAERQNLLIWGNGAPIPTGLWSGLGGSSVRRTQTLRRIGERPSFTLQGVLFPLVKQGNPCYFPPHRTRAVPIKSSE